jgi:penicillin G amidase
MRLLLRAAAVSAALLAIVVLGYVINAALGMRAHARYTGTISGLRLHGPVSILRDDRGVPHILAADDRDLFFAQGYVEGSDRLFQMDLLRRFIRGELAEVFGGPALRTDEEERAIPIRAIVAAQWARLDLPTRRILGTFSDGVNAAMRREPLPVEFRLLGYKPQPWTPEDSLAVGMAEVLDLIDDWDAIAPRDAAYRRGGLSLLRERFPLTDPCYDAPVTAGLAGMAPGDRCNRRRLNTLVSELSDARAPIGSNEWAVGANLTAHKRSLLANDPHLGLGIPGVWYLVDLHSPGYRVAGVTLPGLPSVILGHNERVAWGATAGTVASLSVFSPPAHLDERSWENEQIGVRFGRAVTKRYYRTKREFGVTTKDGEFVLVRWFAYDHPDSPATAFLELDRAASIDEAIAVLAKLPQPSLNFALADSGGRAAYVLSGAIPDDPVRARWFHPPADLAREYPAIPFVALPRVRPSRNAIVWTANNKMYDSHYPLQLSPQFAPPYRAYRIAQLLRSGRAYDVDTFARMQMDVLSLPERELARSLAPAVRRNDASLAQSLTAWNGQMDGDSTTGTIVEAARLRLTDHHNGRLPTLLETARSLGNPWAQATPASAVPWQVAGAVPVPNSLSKLGINFLDGVTLPGNGDAFTLHVQTPGYAQSFRAVWDVGDWDSGGITLPQGESGEPGSGHYTDQAAAWISGRLWPLPFSDGAVQRTAESRETLLP